MFKRVLLVIVSVISAFVLTACGAASDVVDALSKGDVIKANRIYVDKIEGNSRQLERFDEEYEKYLSGLYNELNKGKISPDEVSFIIAELKTFKHPSRFDDYKDRLSELITSKEAYQTGGELLAKKQNITAYLDAYSCFSKVVPDDVNYESAQLSAENALAAFVDDSIAQAKEYLNDKGNSIRYGEAFNAIEAAFSSMHDREIYNAATEYKLNEGKRFLVQSYVSDSIEMYEWNRERDQHADGLIDLYSAYRFCTEYYPAYSDDEQRAELANRISDACKEYTNYSLDEASRIFSELLDYSEAEYYVHEAISNYNSWNSDEDYSESVSLLESALEYYDSFFPVLLKRDNTLYYDGSLYHVDDFDDNYGNHYNGGYIYKTDASATYNVSDYDEFSCRVVIPAEHKNDEYCGTVTILLDGNVAYTSGSIGRGASPVDITLSTNGASTLTIAFSGNYGGSSFYNMVDGTLVLVQPVIYKNPANHPSFEERLP